LLKLLKENEVTDFKLERGGERISLKRGPEQVIQSPQAVVAQPPAVIQPTHQLQAVPPVAAAPHQVDPASNATTDDSPQLASRPGLNEIKSPMVGTFYTRSAPDADPFVSVGDIVSKGDTLCIIEAMKIMNEIESEKSGRIVEVCLEDGQMAEYEEALFRIEPN